MLSLSPLLFCLWVADLRSGKFVPPWFSVLATAVPSAAYPPAVSLTTSALSPVVCRTHPVAANFPAPSHLDPPLVVGATVSCCSVAAVVVAALFFPALPSFRLSVLPCTSVLPRPRAWYNLLFLLPSSNLTHLSVASSPTPFLYAQFLCWSNPTPFSPSIFLVLPSVPL